MGKKLHWNKIKDFYVGHWVELVDFEWAWDAANPAWANVRHCSSDRAELLKLIKQDGEVANSVIMFISNGNTLVGSFDHRSASNVIL